MVLSKKKKRDTAASMLEAAIALPIFLLFVLFIIDISRFFFITLVLNWAAHSAVDLASKYEVESNTNLNNGGTICDPAGCMEGVYPATPPNNCTNFHNYWLNVRDKARNIALLVTSDSNTPSGAQLYSWDHYLASDYICDTTNGHQQFGIGLNSISSEIAFLRPGERVRRTLNHSIAYDHPRRKCADSSTKTCGFDQGYGPPKPGENWSQLLDKYPLLVMLEFRFSFVTPFLPDFDSKVVQAAYRTTRKFGQGQQGGLTVPTSTRTITSTPSATRTLGSHDLSTPTITATPSASHTPTTTLTPSTTPTASTTPTPSVTLTPSQTPTETATETITPSPTPSGTGTITGTPTRTGTPTQTHTASLTPTVTETPTASKTPTVTLTPTITATPTITNTSTSTPTDAPMPTETSTPVPPPLCTTLCGSTGCNTTTCLPPNGSLNCCSCCLDYGRCTGCGSAF